VREAGQVARTTRYARRRVVVASGVLALSGVLVGSVHADAASGPSRPSVTSEHPRVLAVHPGTTNGKGGKTILVLGRGFMHGTSITVGGRTAHVLSVRNPNAVYARAPRGFGTEEVRAVTKDGTSTTNARSVLHFDTRVLVVGDSLGIDLGWGFTPSLDASEHLVVTDDAVGSSGLVRSDFFDWTAHLRADIAVAHPDVVETLFGTNDEQAFRTSRGLVEPGTLAWDRAYSARVRQIASIVHRAGATLVWVGLPRMGPQSVLDHAFMAHLDALDRTVVGKLRRAIFVNAWAVFTTPRGAYTPYVEVAPHVWVDGHQPDGTHLTPSGANVIDTLAVEALRAKLTR
jgi:hypothetical protein